MKRFGAFALFCLIYNLGVIVWGAYVRASGSGAGCGSHWPLCNGEIIPRPERIQTVIEFSHRASSGLSLVFAAVLMVWAIRAFPRPHPARRAAIWAFVFTITEALIGAALVLLALVERNQSVDRAVSISFHLVNTLVMLAFLALTARWAHRPREARLELRGRETRLTGWLAASVLGMGMLGVTGALNALGDTLFRSTSLAAGWAQDFARGSNFLVRLRIFHPALAVLVAGLLLAFTEVCQRARESREVHRWSLLLRAAVLGQLALGGLNLFLLAPVPMQLAHLAMADVTWICLVVLGAAAIESQAGRALDPFERRGNDV